MSAVDFILSLLSFSEKAAMIARACRENSQLLSLLVQEKIGSEKNNRFADFKTLADVLIQELFRYDLEKRIPTLKGFIYGEEDNCFTNTLGETVALVINDDKSNTISLLTKILDGDADTACILANFAHTDIPIKEVPVHSLPDNISSLNMDDLALWIDPIDSTTEYIRGGVSNSDDISFNGLSCVTVLVGAFYRSTGVPIVGVLNQPFHDFVDGREWKGQCFWGFSQDGYCVNSIPIVHLTNRKPLIAVSSFEENHVKRKLEKAGYELISPAGAGNKCLGVILGKVDVYVCSQGSTYYWDTCGSHAILKSLQGNMWEYNEAMKGNFVSLRYQGKTSTHEVADYSNKYGLIAFRNEQVARNVVKILQSC